MRRDTRTLTDLSDTDNTAASTIPMHSAGRNTLVQSDARVKLNGAGQQRGAGVMDASLRKFRLSWPALPDSCETAQFRYNVITK